MPIKNRTDLKSYFVKNAIPTEGNFADLIDSGLNQAQDGVFKLEGEPLTIVAAAGAQKRALRLYSVYPAANPDWMVNLTPALDPANAATTSRPGLGIADATGNTRLLIEAGTGRIGLGTTQLNLPAKLCLGMDIANTKLALHDHPTDTYGLGIQGGQLRIHVGNPGARFSFLNAPAGAEVVTILGSGRVGLGIAAPGEMLSIAGAGNGIELGAGVTGKEVNAGKIMYGRWDPPALELVGGGGPTSAQRRITMWAEGGAMLWGPLKLTGKLAAGNYAVSNAVIGAPTMEIGGPNPIANGSGGAVLYLHHHGAIAHQLRYNGGTLFLEAAGAFGYATSPRPTLALGGDVNIEGKHALRGNDTWLRLNQDGAFTAGVHTPGNFAPMSLNVGGLNGWGNPGAGNAWVTGKMTVVGGTVSNGLNLGCNGTSTSYTWPYESVGTDNPGHNLRLCSRQQILLHAPTGVVVSKGNNGTASGNGAFTVEGSKNFRIDHPLDPEKRYLVHSCLEGPEAAVLYRGEAVLADGVCEITLPPYFEALTRQENRTVQVTPKLEKGAETSALAAGAVEGGRFMVRAIDRRNPSQRFYWEVKAVRADLDPIAVEPLKSSM
ncbi:MAG TPA: hypothetical protein VFU23_06630 [Gemmatimonadales bacterium]|nr:hypothetical protein [Gemmatimonadales bacterium]